MQDNLLAPHAARTLKNFAVVGAIGFAIDAILLTILMQWLHWLPWLARIPSFGAAVLTTWLLNRRHTFAGRGLQRTSLEAFLYISLQIGGAILNFAVFGTCIAYSPSLIQFPVIALAVGAIAGFAFNFATSKFLLYSRLRA